MIPEIDIWRATNLMLKRYGEKTLEERSVRAQELAAAGDADRASRHFTELAGVARRGSLRLSDPKPAITVVGARAIHIAAAQNSHTRHIGC